MKTPTALIKTVTPFVFKLVAATILSLQLLAPNIASADNLRLVDKPLVDSTVSDVLPNLMFILDNSGSMNFNYTPDWAGNGRRWEFRNAAYNTQYYNPEITYVVPVGFSGVKYPSYTNPDSVRTDGFFANTNYNMATHLDASDTHNSVDTINTDTLQSLTNNAHYYHIVPGEHCTTAALTNCIATSVSTPAYQFPAPIRWCNSAAQATAAVPTANSCRSIREGAFTNLRAPRSTFTLTLSRTSGTASVSSVKVNNMEILASTATSTSSQNTGTNGIAAQVASRLCTGNTTGNCELGGVTVTRNSNVLTITTPAGAFLSGPTVTSSSTTVGAAIPVAPILNNIPGSLVYVEIAQPTTTTYPLPGRTAASAERTDCGANSACTYAQEITNFSNWYAYYRTRMQGMKTSSSLAFEPIDNKYRVGFITINNQGGNYLPVAKFEEGAGQQKSAWYTRLFNTVPDGATPLRNTLSVVGRIFAGKKPLGGTADPVEYACQPNFALLTTDGYWNEDGSGIVNINGGAIGNLDGAGTPRPLYEGGTAASNTLADVAKYFYDTDIRATTFSNCTGALGQNVCGDGAGNENIAKQNLTTLTLGLGIDGTLIYSSDYKTQNIGDFASIRAGTLNWPVPSNNSPTGIDDLWHAAVNANGSYFSARTPKELSESLKKALSDIQSKVGTGSAAAASSLQPTAGDNFDYVASYETVKWTGNLESRIVDLETLETSKNATWCVENIASTACTAPSQLSSEDGAFFCRTSNSTEATCAAGGTLVGTDCRKPVATACVGTLRSKVFASTDTRNIYFNKGGALTKFEFGNLNATQQSFFSATYLSTRLSQWPDYSAAQQTKAAGANLVNYLRGQVGFEDRTSNAVIDRIYRTREAVLGDITESQPAFVGKSKFSYVDSGYDSFKSAQAGRSPTVYVGANDGMLHAFNATTGEERWAFVPTPAISRMWKLADKSYGTNHINFVNGDAFVADIFAGSWKTILVSGMSGGGRGYFALDITNPESPQLLWEKTASDANMANLGYTFGTPIVTKLNGVWVAIFTSGYNNGSKDNDGVTNNVPAGDGKGYLYIVNANTGVLIKTITTGVGDQTTPSGFAPIAAYVDDLIKDNSAKFVIGGDLLGNLWKFNITINDAPINLATLRGPGGVAQPITTVPQLATVSRLKVVFVGTGKYLEPADLNPVSADRQSIYGIKIDSDTPLGNPRGLGLVPQVLTGAGDTRTIATSNPVDFTSGLGWVVDFPLGERVNIDPFLVNGVLLAPTIVPASTSCSPGGFGYFNFFNYKNGGPVVPGGVVSQKYNTPIVGYGVSYDKNGNPVLKVVTSDNNNVVDKNDILDKAPSFSRSGLLQDNKNGTYGTRYNWRELMAPQE